MEDQFERRQKVVELLETALQLANEMGQVITAYLLGLALEEARAALWER